MRCSSDGVEVSEMVEEPRDVWHGAELHNACTETRLADDVNICICGPGGTCLALTPLLDNDSVVATLEDSV